MALHFKSLKGVNTSPVLQDIKPEKIRQYPKGILAWDTETDKNGNVFLVCNSSDRISSLWVKDPKQIIPYLFKHGTNHLNFFFNMRFDLEVILKWYWIEQCTNKKEQRIRTKIGKYDPIIDGITYHIRELKGKQVTISVRKTKVSGKWVGNSEKVYFYDLAKSFPYTTLNSLAKDLLGKEKNDIDAEHFEKYSNEEIEKYCKQDCVLTKEIAEKLLIALDKLGIKTSSFTGCPHYAEVFALKPEFDLAKEFRVWKCECKSGNFNGCYHSKNYHDWAKIQANKGNSKYENTCSEACVHYPIKDHQDILKLAYSTFYGGIFDISIKGTVKEEIDVWDCVSQYPDKIANLPDMNPENGYWRKVIGDYSTKATYGVYRVVSQLAPFVPYRKDGKLVVYPDTNLDEFGLLELRLTLPEIIELERLGKRIEVIDGYEFIHTKTPTYPFKKMIQVLYEGKSNSPKNTEMYWLYKILMNSLYGKFCQTAGKRLGQIFNPVFASYITALSRIQIFRFRSRYLKDWFSTATDGVYGFSLEGIPKETTKEMGYFSYERSYPQLTFIQTGFYFDKDRKAIKARGVYSINSKKTKFEYVKVKDQLEIQVWTKRPKHQSEMIIQCKIEDIGKFVETRKLIRVLDKKKNWSRDVSNWEFLFENAVKGRVYEDLDFETFLEDKPIPIIYDFEMPTTEILEEQEKQVENIPYNAQWSERIVSKMLASEDYERTKFVYANNSNRKNQ